MRRTGCGTGNKHLPACAGTRSGLGGEPPVPRLWPSLARRTGRPGKRHCDAVTAYSGGVLLPRHTEFRRSRRRGVAAAARCYPLPRALLVGADRARRLSRPAARPPSGGVPALSVGWGGGERGEGEGGRGARVCPCPHSLSPHFAAARGGWRKGGRLGDEGGDCGRAAKGGREYLRGATMKTPST